MTSPRRALVVIDVQQQYFSGPLEIEYPPHAESLPRIAAALDAADRAEVPVAVLQHTAGEGAPVFDPTTPEWQLHPEVAQRVQPGSFHAEKQYGTVFAGTGLLDWLRERDVDTLTLVGYMTNNCVLASAAEAETHGLAVEVLSDATGAIGLSNEAGSVDARTVHTTLLALLHSNWAAVTDTAGWTQAVEAGTTLPGSNLVVSATQAAAG
ncbi:isochorismatase family protein [Modestobacter sp. VKM Ac-2986]|uniref:isochorismatase family protein n=1 Tax=Modestobacter sp. VKM Ac-2986 TaxID=3004140 RepID=UPI0022AAB165|nr:isochorismatase family protein [Modestobacter sp. VKM Ac-2986]MCZ2827595.1 isochorismatase family protein [Modestobacter sp. VKM Ac-2986]